MHSIEQLVDIPAAGFPAWSSDGLALAYLHDTPGAGWLLTSIEPATGKAHTLSATPVMGSRPVWSPDCRSIAVVRVNAERGSDIWLIAADGSGGERRLVGGPFETRSPSFSPDGSRLAYICGEAGSLDVWVVDMDAGEPQRLTQATNPLDEPRWSPRWSPDGRWIAHVSSRSGERNNDDLWLVSPDSEQQRQLTTGLMVNTDGHWSPDGSALAIVANTSTEHWYGDDADVWLVNAGEGPSQRLTPAGGHSWRLEGAGLAWSPDGTTVYALSHANGNRNVTAVPTNGGVRTAVTNLAGVVTDFALSPDGETLAFIHASQTSPPDLYVMPVAGGLPTRLTDCVATVAGQVRKPRRAPYRTFDGLYCDSYLYLPPNFEATGRYPGLIQVHGGGTNSYGNGWHPVEQWLANQGFVVMAVEYRGSSGYGRAFAGLSYADWGGGQTTDSVAAGRWLAAQPFIGKVGIYGGSYGGYLTLHSIVAAPELFDAAVDMYGKTNMVTAQQYADRVGRVFVARDYWGRLANEIPEAMERASTYNRLGCIRTPLLILHGDRDPRVPPIESMQVAEKLSELGIEHQYVVYPGEGHGFRKREHRIDCYTRMRDWFQRLLVE